MFIVQQMVRMTTRLQETFNLKINNEQLKQQLDMAQYFRNILIS